MIHLCLVTSALLVQRTVASTALLNRLKIIQEIGEWSKESCALLGESVCGGEVMAGKNEKMCYCVTEWSPEEIAARNCIIPGTMGQIDGLNRLYERCGGEEAWARRQRDGPEPIESAIPTTVPTQYPTSEKLPRRIQFSAHVVMRSRGYSPVCAYCYSAWVNWYYLARGAEYRWNCGCFKGYTEEQVIAGYKATEAAGGTCSFPYTKTLFSYKPLPELYQICKDRGKLPKDDTPSATPSPCPWSWCSPTPSPTTDEPSATPSPTPSSTPDDTPSATPSPTPSPTTNPTPSPTPSPTAKPAGSDGSSDGCTCLDEWTHWGTTYSGCSITPDFDGKPWCYVDSKSCDSWKSLNLWAWDWCHAEKASSSTA